MQIQADTGTIFASQTSVVYTVPAGQRLAIEFLTVSGTKEKNQSLVHIGVTTTLDSAALFHPIRKKLQDEFDASGAFVESALIRLYADENTDVVVRVVGDKGSTVKAWGATISGRLEPI